MNRVVLTGTGVPVPDPGRAGAGALVDIDGVRLQVDAGRGTVLRLAGAMVPLQSIDAVLLTHHHSDHLVGLADLLLTRWISGAHHTTIVAPDGPTARFAAGVLDQWHDDIAVRIEHAGHGGAPTVEVVAFDRPTVPPRCGVPAMSPSRPWPCTTSRCCRPSPTGSTAPPDPSS